MNIAFYLRLSIADGDLEKGIKDESNSIENQRRLLWTYLQDSGMYSPETDTVTEYVDDGYSGTNFNRPSFNKLIEDVKRGKIHTILIKDFSRLGRDYITVGDYIEQIFPLLGIRLISVNNGYDSVDTPTVSLDMEVTNLVNTLYSRDISKKVRSGNLARYRNGTKVANRIPYGYRKEGAKWVVDQEAADVVRLIFEEAGNGRSTSEIAAILNAQKISIRAEYQRTHGMNLYGAPVAVEHERLWNSAMVSEVIRTYAYTGALVGGKLETIAVGSHKVRKKAREEWHVLENDHEPIVSREVFEKAQMVLETKKRTGRVIPKSYALKGKIRCGNCHRVLTYRANNQGGCFFCSYGKKQGEFSNCCKENYSVEEVKRAVEHSLEPLISSIAGLRKNKATDGSENLDAMEKEIRILKDEKLKLYEGYAEGVFTKEDYLKRKKATQEKIESLEAEKEKLRCEEEKRRELNEAVDEALDGIEVSPKVELTPELEERFIEIVYIHGHGRIEIVYKLEDIIRKNCGCELK